MAEALAWRQAWEQTPQADQRHALFHQAKALEDNAESVMSVSSMAHAEEGIIHSGTIAGRPGLMVPARRKCAAGQYSFLNRKMCRRAFERLTGTSLYRAFKQLRLGHAEAPPKTSARVARRLDQMKAAIWVVLEHLSYDSPYGSRATQPENFDKRELILRVPFHHKVCLWRLIDLASKSVPNIPLPSGSSYSCFRRAMLCPEFRLVRFHRIVDIGRCPKCCYLQYTIAAVPRGLKSVWQTAFSKHHMLQLKQKQQYAKDRAIAAVDYPNTEM